LSLLPLPCISTVHSPFHHSHSPFTSFVSFMFLHAFHSSTIYERISFFCLFCSLPIPFQPTLPFDDTCFLLHSRYRLRLRTTILPVHSTCHFICYSILFLHSVPPPPVLPDTFLVITVSAISVPDCYLAPPTVTCLIYDTFHRTIHSFLGTFYHSLPPVSYRFISFSVLPVIHFDFILFIVDTMLTFLSDTTIPFDSIQSIDLFPS